MVETAGVEPASKIARNSSHLQVCLIYYHLSAKIDGYNLTLTVLLR